MLTRRRMLQASLAAPFVAAPAHGGPLVKVRYSEVIRSILYAPAYVAMAKGFFTAVGLDVALTTANGSDKGMAALLSGAADIALIGPDAAIYVLTSESREKARLFSGLTAKDGFMLVGRTRVETFDWQALKGKDILGFRPGSTPLLFFQAAMRRNGVDPDTNVRLTNNLAIPARAGSWLAGQHDYAIFPEPDASQLERDGKAFFLASIGQAVGSTAYTAFAATDAYLHDNPHIVQSWTDAISRALQWTAAASADEIATAVAPWFPNTDLPVLTAAASRYRSLQMWKTTPVIEPSEVAMLQDILIAGHVLEPEKRVKFDDLVRTTFAAAAK